MRGLKYKIITVLAVFVMPFCAEVSGQSFNTLNPGMGDFNDMNFQTPGGIGANPFQTEEGPLDSARMDTTKRSANRWNPTSSTIRYVRRTTSRGTSTCP